MAKVPLKTALVIIAVVAGMTSAMAADPPVDRTLEQRIRQLIHDLASEHYGTYRQAREALIAIGHPAIPLLTPVAKGKDKRMSDRASVIIKLIEREGEKQRIALQKEQVALAKQKEAEEKAKLQERVSRRLTTNAPLPADLSADLMATLGIRLGEAGDGLRVTDLKADSPAAKAGIRVGDIITNLNGHETPTLAQLRAVLETVEAGQVIVAQLTRRGEFLNVTFPEP